MLIIEKYTFFRVRKLKKNFLGGFRFCCLNEWIMTTLNAENVAQRKFRARIKLRKICVTSFLYVCVTFNER